MPWVEFIWTETALAKIAANHVTQEEAEQVVREARTVRTSRSSGRPLIIGYTPAGRRIAVVFERIDGLTVQPITAFDPEQE